LTNGVPIFDYEGDKADEILLNLTIYLKEFLNVPDVRDKINSDFDIMKTLQEKGPISL
jgi:hypothetical protein